MTNEQIGKALYNVCEGLQDSFSDEFKERAHKEVRILIDHVGLSEAMTGVVAAMIGMHLCLEEQSMNSIIYKEMVADNN